MLVDDLKTRGRALDYCFPLSLLVSGDIVSCLSGKQRSERDTGETKIRKRANASSCPIFCFACVCVPRYKHCFLRKYRPRLYEQSICKIFAEITLLLRTNHRGLRVRDCLVLNRAVTIRRAGGGERRSCARGYPGK